MEYVVYLEFVDGARYTVAQSLNQSEARNKARRLNAIIEDGKAHYCTRERFERDA